MLYDNAQLARVYLHAFQVTGDPRYLDVARDTLDYVVRDLRRAGRHVRGEPGRRHRRRRGADLRLVGRRDRRRPRRGRARCFSTRTASPPTATGRGERSCRASVAGRGDEAAEERACRPSRERLLDARDGRPQPARDDKALAAWNGLVIAAFADASRVSAGEAGARTATRRMMAADSCSPRCATPMDGCAGRGRTGRAAQDGVLEDYTHLADGLLALYEATFEERWFTAARDLVEQVLTRFADPAGGFFDTAADAERLVTRPKDLQDNAIPSGNAMAAPACCSGWRR